MSERFIRTQALLGNEAMKTLQSSHVAIFGIGGVGGYVVEALARSGVGKLTLVDSDVVAKSNINRQIIALDCTVGQPKVEAAKERIRQINPLCQTETIQKFVLPGTIGEFDFKVFDYVVDAVDTVSAKLAIIVACKNAGTPVISCMGTGNKLDATKLEVSDISKTSVCPLARVMRIELRKRGVNHVKTVYSKEEPKKVTVESDDPSSPRRAIPGSSAFVPAAAGLIIASEVVKDLIGYQKEG